ncbi:MAG: hypothetical protein R2746_04285 [Acidimicrobiales bacterium]
MALVVAARKGDPAAFAQLLEHWDRHLRAFVHHTLGGDGATERVLAAAYLRAYRALPRYTGELKPGLWLHRIAYLAALDDLRRGNRDPLRRPGARPDDGRSDPPADGADTAAVLARLAPDQRALAVMVDLERYRLTTVSVAFDTPPAVAGARLGAARRALVAGAAVDQGGPEALVPARPKVVAVVPDAPVDLEVLPTPPGEVPIRPPHLGAHGRPAERRGVGPAGRAGRGRPVEDEPVDDGPVDDGSVDDGSVDDDEVPAPAADRSDELGYRVHLALAELPVPPASPTFWADLGRRLLAERAQPAAPTPDPVARLARHPAEPGFQPDHAVSDTVSVMADQAERTRPRRDWRRPLLVAAVVLVVAAVVGAAVRYGTSERPPDGSVPATQVADALTAALAGNELLSVSATVDEPGGVSTPYAITLDEGGSWSISRSDTIDLVTYDASSGIVRTVTAQPGDGATPVVEATIAAGLAAGPPDTGPVAPTVLADLQRVGVLVRSDPDRRAAPTSSGDEATWTITRDVDATGSTPAARWSVEVRRSDGFPVSIEVRADGDLVRRTRFRSWTPGASAPAGTFDPPVPDGVSPSHTTAGFVTTDLDGVATLGRGDATTPEWLPEGFELATVAVRSTAPEGTTSTRGGANPPDVDVVSLGFQRGPERIVVSTRASGGRSRAWQDPFASDADSSAPIADTRTLGDGRFNGLEVVLSTDGFGRAQLWGVTTETVLTVSGDLTEDEAIRVASSLRG